MKKLTFILFLVIWQLINISESPGQGKGSLTNFGNKWGWTGTGEAFVPQLVMYGNPSNFYNNPAKIDSDIQTFIVGHGFNGFHVSVYCRWFDLDKEDCVSTVGSNPNIDPRTFDALEDLITKTYAAGGMVHIWMWGDGNNNPSVRLDWGGLNGSVEMNLLQEIANRLGPLPGWTMGYGFDVTEWSSETEATVWHDSLQSFFPQAHSLGARADGPNTGTNHSPFISWNQGFDYSSYEHHQPTYDVYTAALDALPGKPVMSEDRFRIRNPPNSKDYTPDETRQGLWNSTMAGGVANIWGNLTNGGSHANGTAPYPNAAQIKTYSLFFENRFQKDMTAFNNGNVYSLIRSTNTGYVFYQENTSSMQLDLSAMVGSQSAVAVDTKLLYSEIPLGTLNPTLQTWNAPYASDWAIAIGNFSGIPPIAVASATPLTGPAPLDVIFNSDNSLDPDGTIVSFWWDFGDGNSSPDSNPTHTYVTEGTFKAVLSVTDNEGHSTLDSVFITVDNTEPTIPTKLTATAVSADQIDLAWDESADNIGVAGYNLYRDGVYLVSTTSLNYSDTGLNASTQYCYTVSAVDAAGNESIQSQQACATTLESNTMHVENISIDYLATGPWNKYTPSVLIYDMTSQPVGNATVTGEWSGALSGTDSITTDSNGLAIFSQKKTKSANSVTFCVIDVTHNNFPWVPSENLETCVTAQQTSLSKQNASAQALIPVRYRLFPNYPNPFNPETEIRFQLPEASHVVVRIYNALGQEIRTLADGQYEAGFQSISWDGKDNKGSLVSSGIYLYQLKAGVFSQIK
ncbi:PKD domain-containing protein, partial [candidate division KSB1 bacterium]|nr:PKD domain-containing protein [candidate division KSB1 bacterium]